MDKKEYTKPVAGVIEIKDPILQNISIVNKDKATTDAEVAGMEMEIEKQN